MCGIIDLSSIYNSGFMFCITQSGKVLSNIGNIQFDGLVHLLIYIRDNKNLGLKYYYNIEDSPLYDLLRHSSIKNDNQLVVLSDSIWKDIPDTDRNTGSYIVFYQGGPIDNWIHVPGPVSKYGDESE